jgi:hypothetical protein
VNRLSNAEELAKEMVEFCKQVIKSVANPAPPVLMVVDTALAVEKVDDSNKGKGFWSKEP